ncbi:MAG: lysine--tRNA ligase [Candidatus Bathyarchaeota archaeon]|nr:lysine--tRNA ligase [Candidatus Bathyarchaeota archaeon]MDH5733317.1 lysine--tRNA ligase [Candidatus Bathyarchaeota archaeon]
MREQIIGHGTWYDKMAVEILERERKLDRSLDLIRTEMGITASGFPHVGSLGDAARSFAVTLALRNQGYNSKMIAFSDDKDGLRKVPAGIPPSLKKYLGFPVSSIPDPYKCHESYGRHMSSLLLEALDKCGIDYQFMTGSEAYRNGLFNKEIETILLHAKRVGEIIREEVGQEKFIEALPYFAVCSNCGRIYTTKVYEFLPKENKLLYSCEGMEIKGQWMEGCGHKDEADYTKGEGKLSWKAGEFAARWKVLDIRFEPYGKDIADSVRVNDRICQEILAYAPPIHAKYELFLDISGKRFSKSAGRIFSPQLWLRYGSPQSLLLLMLKRFVGARSLSVTDIPQYMNELNELEDIHFGRKTISDEKERAKLSGLYKYCWVLKPPAKPNIHVPYNLLTYLAKVAPKDSEIDFIKEKLEAYGYKIERDSKDLERRIEYALNWAQDYPEIKETTTRLNTKETTALKEFIQTLEIEERENQLQGAIFNIARKHEVQPSRFFQILYTILLGVPQGPRLGPYIIAMERRNVIKALKRAIKKKENPPFKIEP